MCPDRLNGKYDGMGKRGLFSSGSPFPPIGLILVPSPDPQDNHQRGNVGYLAMSRAVQTSHQ
jgi:hypothetical protein